MKPGLETMTLSFWSKDGERDITVVVKCKESVSFPGDPTWFQFWLNGEYTGNQSGTVRYLAKLYAGGFGVDFEVEK